MKIIKLNESVGITDARIIEAVCRLSDFEKNYPFSRLASNVEAVSPKPDWKANNHWAGLVSVESYDNNVKVYGFANGPLELRYEGYVANSHDLIKFLDKVSDIQEEELQMYENNEEAHYINSYQYKRKVASSEFEKNIPAIEDIINKYPKTKIVSEFDSVEAECATKEDAEGIKNDIINIFPDYEIKIFETGKVRKPYGISIDYKINEQLN